MYKEFQSGDSLEHIPKALHAIHQEHGVIIGKDSKSNRGTYATLPSILSQIADLIGPKGLILTQGPDLEYDNCIYTLLEHPESGEWRRVVCKLKIKEVPLLPDYMIEKMNADQWNSYCKELLNYSPFQAWGSSTTYQRRYSAMMICGFFAADDPTDFNEGASEIIPEQTKSSGSGFISDKQQSLLRFKLNGDKALADKILMAFNVQKLSEIPWKHFQEVLKFIEEYQGAKNE